MNKAWIGAIFLLTGCASGPQVVSVPTPLPPPEPPVVERPHLPILDIPDSQIADCESSGEGCGEIARALDASLEAAWGWGLELEALLDAYR